MDQIQLDRYMGDWRVIANIPTPFEKNAYNAVEGYRLNPDGTIFNYYECRKGSFDGSKKRFTAKAWVKNKETNAEWRVQFVWPIRFAYQILEVGSDYEYTVVGHPSKKYVWIMARAPKMDESVLGQIIGRLKKSGYPTEKIALVPQESTPSSQH